MYRRFCRAAGAALLLTIATTPLRMPTPAAAQSPAPWPQATVKFILPLGPGSGADIGARMFADRLGKLWGQAIVVENRPGGDSILAITAFIGANDQHTLLWGPAAAFTAHPYTQSKLPYDPSAIVPIARVTNTLVAMSVPATAKEATLADLVARIKAEPGKLNWAAMTGLDDFVFQSFVKANGLLAARVPYRDAVQALNDLAEDRIQLFDAAYAISRPQVEAGKVKVLAFMNSSRAPVLPDVPTVREAGFPALEFDGLVGLYGPRGLPIEARQRIAADVIAVAKDAEILSRLTATGQVVNPGSPAEFEASIQKQRDLAAAAGKVLGITPVQYVP